MSLQGPTILQTYLRSTLKEIVSELVLYPDQDTHFLCMDHLGTGFLAANPLWLPNVWFWHYKGIHFKILTFWCLFAWSLIIIPRYFAVTTEYTNTYPVWKAGRGTEAPFVLKATIYYPEERILYPLMHFNFSHLNHSSSKQEEIIIRVQVLLKSYYYKTIILLLQYYCSPCTVHHSWHNPFPPRPAKICPFVILLCLTRGASCIRK